MKIKMKTKLLKLFLISIIFFNIVSFANAAPPILNFSDITSGPKIGNTDEQGSGAIVTIWGNNLGASQGNSKIYVGGAEATKIYYWKNADGQLPSGPAELYSYHEMQEVAFAIPAGAPDGTTTIKITVDGVDSNTLPFTVRTGNIKFVKSGGTDNSSCGQWSSPCATMQYMFNGGNSKVAAGDIVYSVGVGSTAGLKVGADATISGTSSNPIALVGYPNTSVNFSGLGGNAAVITNWYPSARNNQYVNFSKFKVTAYGNDPQQANGIECIPYDRIVGVEITGPNVYFGYGGAITGTNGVPKGGKYLGIYIHHYGYPTNWSYNWDDSTWTSPPYNGVAGEGCTNCTTVDRFQHLYYISNRAGTGAVEAYEIGWNHLTDNPILHGIHIYDMGSNVGWSGTLKIHHNVVKNQRGAAMDFSFPTNTAVSVYNNLIIQGTSTNNTGEGFDIRCNSSNFKFYNNTVYGYKFVNKITEGSASVDYRNNIIFDLSGVSYTTGNPVSQSNNLFYSTYASIPSLPSWYSTGSNINANPLFTNVAESDFSLQSSSPALNVGYNTSALVFTDLIGSYLSSTNVSVGAYTGSSGDITAPIKPTNLRII